MGSWMDGLVPQSDPDANLQLPPDLSFRPLQFANVRQARCRALLVYLCTYRFGPAGCFRGVPLLRREELWDPRSLRGLVEMWDHYGLVWEEGDRTALHELKKKVGILSTPLVAVAGSMRHWKFKVPRDERRKE